jgi:CBS domain-containing protein
MSEIRSVITAQRASARPVGELRQAGAGIKVGHLAARHPVTARPNWLLRQAARTMHEHGVGSVIVLDNKERLVGILTERDILRATAADVDPDAATVGQFMTREVVTCNPAWEVYEAAAEMSDRRIRHLVVTEGEQVIGMLSIRDVLLAGQRVELTDANWAVLRDPLTFTVRERRRLQRNLLGLDAGGLEVLHVDGLIAQLVASWSLDVPLPVNSVGLSALREADYELLRAAVLEELPYLQRAVQPSPGWRRWTA